MRHGRTTTDPKEQTIKLRLNDIMRSWIEKQAYRNGISMSEYIRELISQDMHKADLEKLKN